MARTAGARELPPPLELLCLRALWSLGEGNVRDVQQAVAPMKTLAYTTVMTLLDRLARKGLVGRRKVSRAFLYAPLMPQDTIRRIALREFLNAYFEGSEEGLHQFLRSERVLPMENGAAGREPESKLDTTLL